MSHHSFFERIDAQFVEVGDFTAAALLSTYGPAELRKHLLVMRFLEVALGLTLAEQDKLDSADRERIAAKIADSSRYPWGRLITDYAATLEQADVALRTRRMYISSAAAFCNSVAFNDDVPWTGEDVRRFLKKKPGGRANLVKFLGFCRQKYGWSVDVPPLARYKVGSKSSHRTVAELRKLLQQIKAAGVEHVQPKTLAKIIAKSLGLRIGDILLLSPEQVLEKAGSIVLSINGELIDIPAQLEDVTRSYVAGKVGATVT